jgi:hypothetical protein
VEDGTASLFCFDIQSVIDLTGGNVSNFFHKAELNYSLCNECVSGTSTNICGIFQNQAISFYGHIHMFPKQ